MLAPADSLSWLRTALAERPDVHSAEIEKDGSTCYVSVILKDGARFWVLAPEGYVSNGETPVDWAYEVAT